MHSFTTVNLTIELRLLSVLSNFNAIGAIIVEIDWYRVKEQVVAIYNAYLEKN